MKIKGIEVELSGEKFVVPPLSLASLEDLQDRLSNFKGGVDKESVSTVIDAAFQALKRNYPDMTRERVREMIGLENMADVMMAVMDVSGVKRKKLEAETLGEAPARDQ
jgi:hypothetical protein